MKLAFITSLLLVTWVGRTTCETYDAFVMRTLQQMCPYTSFCHRNATKTLGKNEKTCCLPCSCEKTCKSRNNCCADYNGPEDSNSSAEACLPMSEYKVQTGGDDLNGLNQGIHFYHTINSCPPGRSSDQTAIRCRLAVPKTFLDAVRVSDDNGRVYRNYHCATCHGVTDYTTWQLRMAYSGRNREDFTKFDPATLLANGFRLVSVPPVKHRNLISRCYRPVYKACNQSGEWPVANHYTARACDSLDGAYHILRYHRPYLYRNPFCYICNVDQRKETKLACAGTSDQLRGTLGGLTAILDMHAAQRLLASKEKTGYICRDNEIYDQNFGYCRIFECPIGKVPSRGQCIHLYQATSGMTITFQIAADISGNAEFRKDIQIPSRVDSKDIGHAFIRQTGLSEKGCVFCEIELLTFSSKTSGTEHLLLVSISTSKSCSLDDVNEAIISNIDGTSFPVVLGNTSMILNTSLTYMLRSQSEYHDLRPTEHRIQEFNRECLPGILMTEPKFYCPFVELSQAEYHQLMQSGSKKSLASPEDFFMTDMQESQGEHVYRICMKEYLAQNESAGSGTVTGGKVLVPICLLYLYVVVTVLTI